MNTSKIEVFNLIEYLKNPDPCYDKNYFKVCILEPESKLHYTDKSIHIAQTSLIFLNPKMPYEWEANFEKQYGYFCRFNLDFIDDNELLQETTLTELLRNSVYIPTKTQAELIYSLFRGMMEEKNIEILKLYLKLIIHESKKTEPSLAWTTPANAAARTTASFQELLNKQFGYRIGVPRSQIKHPKDFAKILGVHTNHLNDSVQKTLKKSTSEIINERIIAEAKKLLLNSNQSISEIAYTLNFEYANNFTKFFKKHTSINPTIYRKKIFELDRQYLQTNTF